MKSGNVRGGWFGAIIEAEKREMLPLNFIMSYRVVPVYALVSFLLIAGFGVLMGIDDERYFIPAMILMGALAALSCALLASLPLVRKKAIDVELQRYSFDTANVAAENMWKLNAEGKRLRFDRTGVQIDENAFDYSDLCCWIVTNNYCKRINVSLWILPPADEEGVLLPLTAHTLKMLDCLPIALENPELLAYIINHKEAAFRQIYDKGYVKLPQ